ncbi:MAG: hypothetical protein Q8W46_09260 [Candidatus Palauibacterales bacterium]|nr:hypothetical protein [Candidatus Palauibacterales bacterium]
MTATRGGGLLVLLLAAATASCDGNGPSLPCACTEEFRFFHLTVVDGNGAPADGVEVSVVRGSTGERLEYGQPSGLAPGDYLVMDDSYSDRIGADEAFAVSGVRGAESFTTEFRFGTDACRCHVTLLAGPERVTLSP